MEEVLAGITEYCNLCGYQISKEKIDKIKEILEKDGMIFSNEVDDIMSDGLTRKRRVDQEFEWEVE